MAFLWVISVNVFNENNILAFPILYFWLFLLWFQFGRKSLGFGTLEISWFSKLFSEEVLKDMLLTLPKNLFGC